MENEVEDASLGAFIEVLYLLRCGANLFSSLIVVADEPKKISSTSKRSNGSGHNVTELLVRGAMFLDARNICSLYDLRERIVEHDKGETEKLTKKQKEQLHYIS